MFEVELENFTIWKGINKFSFPDRGLVLISANSGVGKTSILKAIFFCLYGKGRKLVSYGETKMKVTIRFTKDNKKYKIVRTKGPGSLTLKRDKDEYNNEFAQSIISKLFGESDELFMTCSYISQKEDRTFIDLTPAEKLRVIEKCSIDKEEILSMKDKLKENIKGLKQDLLKKEGELSITKAEFKKHKKPKNIDSKEFKSAKEVDTVINEKNNKMKELRDRANQIFNEIKKNKELREKEIKLSSELKSLVEQAKTINSKIDDINKLDNREFKGIEYLNLLNAELNSLKEYELYESRVSKKKSLKEKIEELKRQEEDERNIKLAALLKQKESIQLFPKEAIDTLKEKLTKKNEYGSLHRSFLMAENEYKKLYSSDLENRLNDKRSELSDLSFKLRDLTSRTNIQCCPKCKTSLKVINDMITSEELTPLSQEEKEQVKVLNTKISECKSLISNLETLLNKLNILSSNIKELRSKCDIIKNSLDIDEDYAKIISDEQIKIINLEKINKEISSLPNASAYLKNLTIEYNRLDIKPVDKPKRNEVEIYREKEEQLKYKVRYDESLNNLNNLKKELDRINEKISSIERDISTINYNDRADEGEYEVMIKESDNISKEITLLTSIKEFFQELELYNKWESNLSKVKKEEQVLTKNLTTNEVLLNRILQAEVICIEKVIEDINMKTKIYLEKFFDVPPIIDIASFKVTKKEEKKGSEGKPCINIKVNHNGEDCELSNLSGGEYDRCKVSFLLAFSSLTSSPIMMLDESVSSLNEELVTDILDVLKDQDKLILVISHQAIKGEFEKVIELKR